MTDKEKKAAYDLARRLANPDRKRAENRRYYLNNRDKINAASLAWARNNPERWAEYSRRWWNAEPDRRRRYDHSWRSANPDLVRLKSHRYRARRDGGDLTVDDWALIKDEFENRCAYCNVSGTSLEIEHMTPLSRGGRHTKFNVVPACMSCNRRQGAMTAFEFLGISWSSSLERNSIR